MRYASILLALLFAVSGITRPALSQEDESGFLFPKDGDLPKIVTHAKNVSAFVPRGWHIESTAKGDLNGDAFPDQALFIKGTARKYIQKNEGLGQNPFDTNPRALLIVFFDPSTKGYRLIEKSSLIPIPDSPTMSEPLESMTIKNGVLKIHLSVWFSAGSWSTSNTTYSFRYQNDKFVLIGADSSDYQRNTGHEAKCSINFLTSKVKITISDPLDSEGLHVTSSTRWQRLKSSKLRSLSSFQKPYAWEVIPGWNL